MKICALINESFDEMVLGANSTLAGILSLVDLNYEVFILDISQTEIAQQNQAIFLNKENSENLILAFKEENQKFSESFFLETENNLSKKISELNFEFNFKKFDFDEIDFIYQRLEPMKFPFAPAGKENIEDFLTDFSVKFFNKNKKYNLAINNFGDKELPLKIDKNIAVKTIISNFNDEKIIEKILSLNEEKIVIKPDNSAQSFGVFSVEFVSMSLSLEKIIDYKISELIDIEIYKIDKNQSPEDLLKILQILFFIQDKKAVKKQKGEFLDQKISDISLQEIINSAQDLYNNQILIQPFLKGVREGDIRINLLKFDDEFKVCGAVMRKSIAKTNNFTTGLTSGGSKALRIEDVLTAEEQNDLAKKILIFLDKINQEFKEKYRDIYEIGLDFLLYGDEKKVFLGEANHHCQALIPISEALHRNNHDGFYRKINGLNYNYDGGLSIMKSFFKNCYKS